MAQIQSGSQPVCSFEQCVHPTCSFVPPFFTTSSAAVCDAREMASWRPFSRPPSAFLGSSGPLGAAAAGFGAAAAAAGLAAAAACRWKEGPWQQKQRAECECYCQCYSRMNIAIASQQYDGITQHKRGM